MNKIIATLALLLSGIAVLLATRGQTYHRVNADGPNLRMRIQGRGSPIVIFESGAGAPLETWARIQPSVSRFAQTVAYDRSGNGLSETNSSPRDGKNIAHELHAALRNAGIPPPYVLVGHSLGGPFVRVFAGLFPHEVAGLVLVDPTQEELIEWVKTNEARPTPKREPKSDSEVGCSGKTFAQAREHPLPSHLPIILLAGVGPRDVPHFLTKELRKETAEDRGKFYPAKVNFYRQWLEPFPNGKLVVTEESGHGIPFEEPAIVIRAIKDILEWRGQNASVSPLSP
jgi:pimeloyl-ACP methyl ester carboxylesterase